MAVLLGALGTGVGREQLAEEVLRVVRATFPPNYHVAPRDTFERRRLRRWLVALRDPTLRARRGTRREGWIIDCDRDIAEAFKRTATLALTCTYCGSTGKRLRLQVAKGWWRDHACHPRYHGGRREKRVLLQVAALALKSHSDRRIADLLGISPSTVGKRRLASRRTTSVGRFGIAWYWRDYETGHPVKRANDLEIKEIQAGREVHSTYVVIERRRSPKFRAAIFSSPAIYACGCGSTQWVRAGSCWECRQEAEDLTEAA